MAVKIFNTLSGKKESFKPIKRGKVGLYTCGPTVYNFAHIGNLRTYIFEDILRRTLEYNDYKVRHVMNITDVGHLTSNEDTGEDKIEKAAREQRKNAWEIAKFYTEQFKKDIKNLNIEPANIMPRATDHIKEQIKLIKKLEKKGFTYKTSDGIYFNTLKFKKYGKLGKINLKGLKKGTRINFALWKFSPQSGSGQAKRQMEWDSPWGIGFPGWHIECSAMAVKYLGQPFDIHTGGIDHIPVHHQNEIAQSEAAYDKPLANYWMHGEFLVVDKQRMGKSEGNFIILKNLKEKSFSPISYRYFVLNTHYRKPLNFSWEALESSQNGLERLYNQISALHLETGFPSGNPVSFWKDKFLKAINDDLNTPKALAVVQELIKSNLSDDSRLTTLLDFDKVLGLNFKKALKKEKIPQKIIGLAEKREKLRKARQWLEADKIRKEIKKLGYGIKDMEKGYLIFRRAEEQD